MIFISGIRSIIIQKNTLCTDKILVIYYCPNCVSFFFPKTFIFNFFSERCNLSNMELFVKIVDSWKLHLRCLTRFWIHMSLLKSEIIVITKGELSLIMKSSVGKLNIRTNCKEISLFRVLLNNGDDIRSFN